jgi:hypothetical protein
MAAVYPVFAQFDAKNQDDFLQVLQNKYGKSGGFIEQGERDLRLGFRSGMADLATTGANIAGVIPGGKGVSSGLRSYAQSEAPDPRELQGRDSLAAQVLQGVGSAPPEIAKYAPAIAAGEYAPIVAGAIGAAGAMDKGFYPAIQTGLKDAAGFYLMGKAGRLPTRTARAIGSAAAMAAPTALETKGDLTKTAASAITGAAMGAMQKEHPAVRQFKESRSELIDAMQKGFKAALNPTSTDISGKQTGTILTDHLARFVQKADQADYVLRAIRKEMDRLPANPNNPGGVSDDAQKIQTGRIDQLEPRYQPFAKEIRDKFDSTLERIQQRGRLQEFMENYLPQMWEQGKKSSGAMQTVLSKRPLEGGKGFLRQRVFNTVMDGIAYAKAHPELDLKLVSNNPIDMVLLQLREQEKFLMAHDVLDEMKDRGLIKKLPPGQDGPPGWQKLDDRMLAVRAKASNGGTMIVGHYWAPEGAARVMNNYLSPGFRNNPAYRAYLNAANTLNQFQLGMSAFHLGFTTLDAAVSQHALALEQMIEGARRGNAGMLKEGVKSYIKTPFVPFEPMLKFFGKNTVSNKIMQEWLKPGTHPEVTQLVEMLKMAGGRIQQDPFYRSNGWETLLKADRTSNLASKSLLKLLGYTQDIGDKSSKWLFEYVVPMQKIGAFQRLAQFEMSKLPPEASNMQVREAMQKAWASVDNRMGQLVYDNLFWDKMAKDMLMATVRSVGWNIGTLREVGGGVADTLRALKDSAKGERWEMTHRMAYIVSLPAVVGTVGGIMQYLATGKRPQSIKDYYFPETGEIDEYGRPVRASLPSYIRDIYEVLPQKGEPGEYYKKRLQRKVAGKLHPAISALVDMWQNEDWQNGEIRNPDDPVVKQLLDTAKFGLEQLIPFSFRYSFEDQINAMHGHPRQYSNRQAVEAFFGITPAPADVTKSTAEKAEDRYFQEAIGKRVRSRAEIEKSQLKADLRKLASLHADSDFQKMADHALNSGMLTEKELDAIKRDAGITPVVAKFKRLPLFKIDGSTPAITVYQYVMKDPSITEREKAAIRAALVDKINRGWYKVEALPEGNPLKIKLRNQLRLLNMLDAEGSPVEQ